MVRGVGQIPGVLSSHSLHRKPFNLEDLKQTLGSIPSNWKLHSLQSCGNSFQMSCL